MQGVRGLGAHLTSEAQTIMLGYVVACTVENEAVIPFYLKRIACTRLGLCSPIDAVSGMAAESVGGAGDRSHAAPVSSCFGLHSVFSLLCNFSTA